MPRLAQAPLRRLPLLALVLALHAGLLMWLSTAWHAPAPAPRPASETMMQLLPLLQPPHQRKAPPPDEPNREAHAPPITPTSPSSPAAPAALPNAPAVATLSAPAAPLPPASSPPLNLQLTHSAPGSAAAMLDQIHADPRSHSERVTVEHHIADAAGTLPVEVMESTDGSGGKLVRQGSKCTRVTPARIGTLNPMDSRATSLPSVSGACYH